MKTWQLQEAKARLSEVVKKCVKEGPQMLSLRGEDTAALLSVEDYNALLGSKPSFVEFMQKSPLKGVASRCLSAGFARAGGTGCRPYRACGTLIMRLLQVRHDIMFLLRAKIIGSVDRLASLASCNF